MTERPFRHHLRDVRQVHVHVVQQPRVDLGAGHRVGLVGHAQINAAGGRQRAVQLRRGRRAGPYADGETVTAPGRLGDPGDQRGRYRLRMARTGEPAHPDVIARPDERGRVLSRRHLVSNSLAPKTRPACHPHAPARTTITTIRLAANAPHGWRPRPARHHRSGNMVRQPAASQPAGPPRTGRGTFASIGNTGLVMTWKAQRGGCVGEEGGTGNAGPADRGA